ncbi:MAG: DNA polymerase III subunit beta [Bacillota bacterium]
MKIISAKNFLVDAVQVVQRAVSTKNTLPILAGIYLQAINGTLVARATDLEIGIEYSVPVDVHEEGAVVLPARYITEIVRRLPDTDIYLEKLSDSGTTVIKYGQSSLAVNNYDPDQFPVFPQLESGFVFYINAGEFKNAVKQVSISISHDETRPVFTGVLLEISENKYSLVSTDTHRLSLKTGELGIDPVHKKVDLIVPGRTLIELGKILEGGEDVKVTVGDNQILFEFDNVRLISRLIEGKFPDYRQVIPETFNTKLIVEHKEFLESVERASLLARDEIKSRANVIKIEVGGDTLNIDSQVPDVGHIHEEVQVKCQGDGAQILLNCRYLLDFLRVVDNSQITIELTGPLSPAILRPLEDASYMHLILPVRY